VNLDDVGMLPYLTRTLGSLAPRGDAMFHAFLDAQLLISAQTTSPHVSALYGSAAIDLPRRGVNHVRGGIGQLAQTLVDCYCVPGHHGDNGYPCGACPAGTFKLNSGSMPCTTNTGWPGLMQRAPVGMSTSTMQACLPARTASRAHAGSSPPRTPRRKQVHPFARLGEQSA
jgi:hypothetical protein